LALTNYGTVNWTNTRYTAKRAERADLQLRRWKTLKDDQFQGGYNGGNSVV